MPVALVALLFSLLAQASATPGLARFDRYVPALAGKRVALVVNQASTWHGEHAIDLLRARGVGLVKLFALEHGVRGEGGAGEPIGDGVDAPSGLPIVSLYGPRRKPDDAALRGVDVVLFDVQDVGVRFFTYISSLGLIMEAAAEHRIPVMVLDRPNPNGDYVDGPVLKPELKSFVGAYPIPLVYGLTIGELARMIAGERWQHVDGIALTVVPLAGYDRARPEPLETRPSPGLRSFAAIRAYPMLGLFEPTAVSIGRGTEHPYEVIGAPGMTGAYSFTPSALPPAPGVDPALFAGQLCHGTEFFTAGAPRFTTDFFTGSLRQLGRAGFVRNPRMLDLLVGDRAVVAQLLAGKAWAEIRRGLEPALRAFTARKVRYQLY